MILSRNGAIFTFSTVLRAKLRCKQHAADIMHFPTGMRHAALSSLHRGVSSVSANMQKFGSLARMAHIDLSPSAHLEPGSWFFFRNLIFSVNFPFHKPNFCFYYSVSFEESRILLKMRSSMLIASVAAVSSLLLSGHTVLGLNVVIAGGTGNLGKILIPNLPEHDVTVLSRNSFLASAPAKVTEAFGFLGRSFLDKNPNVRIRDWDGGDLLDIVGQDWVGWQEDALTKADVIVHLVGGYTEQRNMATERLVRESLSVNPNALHITVNPIEEDIPALTPGMVTMKTKRILDCENMVRDNCMNSECLRVEAFRMKEACDAIQKAISSSK